MGSHALLLLVLSVRHAHAWTWTICSGGDTCYNADCDYWDTFGYSCYELEYTYGCDCSSCSSCTPSFAPTMTPRKFTVSFSASPRGSAGTGGRPG